MKPGNKQAASHNRQRLEIPLYYNKDFICYLIKHSPLKHLHLHSAFFFLYLSSLNWYLNKVHILQLVAIFLEPLLFLVVSLLPYFHTTYFLKKLGYLSCVIFFLLSDFILMVAFNVTVNLCFS